MEAVPKWTNRLDYLQRLGFQPFPLPANVRLTSAPPDLRRLWHICGIGRLDNLEQMSGPEEPQVLPTQDLVVALYGYKIPLAFMIWGEPAGVTIQLGTWSQLEYESTSVTTLDYRQKILSTVLESQYPAIKLRDIEAKLLTQPPRSGLVLGIPTAKRPDPFDKALPHDRIIRAMHGASWAFLVLAEPVDQDIGAQLRNRIINEIRDVSTAAEVERMPSPSAEYYNKLIMPGLDMLTRGQAIGLWRTAVYLMGDSDSYYRLASLWRGVFSGDKSLPEPITVWDSEEAGELAVKWAMPDTAETPGPGHYHHPFRYQTLLDSSKLSVYMQLPRLETIGYTVSTVPDFDSMPPPVSDGRGIQIGEVLHRTHRTSVMYSVSPASLTRHTFVAGMTGSGKTNTIKYLLKKTTDLGIPFLIIEPAKREYRELLDDKELQGKIQVFTLGNERYAPFRLNPFEVEGWPETSVGTHIDLLRSVFSASFGMWTPLPQVLEQCLHDIYEDRGWNITTNQNDRLADESDVAIAFPTLSDLLSKIGEVAKQLGYDKEIQDRVQAALSTRINSLRAGGKGCMLDGQHSLSMEKLLNSCVVLELEDMGDDDDKAFMMGLLLIRLAEYRRAHGKSKDLRHLLVFEEAHRLLSNVGMHGPDEEANPRGKAVETFTNLLAEIRAYGQGVIVADQVPVKLAPDIIKNTALKIAHRVVALDDREALAGAMAMSKKQAHALATFGIGEAAVFSQGDDAPVLVKVKEVSRPPALSGATVEKAWEVYVGQHELQSVYTTYPTCQLYCIPPNPGCKDTLRIYENPNVKETFAAFVLSLVAASPESEDSQLATLFGELYQTITGAILSCLSGTRDVHSEIRCVLTHCLYRYMEVHGARYGWAYNDVVHMTKLLLDPLMTARENGHIEGDSVQNLRTFCELYLSNCQLAYQPFYGCGTVCGESPLCLYRYNVESLVQDPIPDSNFKSALETDLIDWSEVAGQCESAARRAVLHPTHADPVRTNLLATAALCFAIQKTHSNPSLWTLGIREFLINGLLEHYGRRR